MTVKSGTAATLWPLHKAKKEDMDFLAAEQAFDQAKPLQLSDIIHTKDEAQLFHKCLIHCILHITVTHGHLNAFEKDLSKALP